MATHYSTSTDNGGTNAAVIILAVIIIAALAVGAIYMMNYNGAPVQNSNTTTERYVSKIQQVPAQTGQAVSRAVGTPAQNAQSPASDQTPAPSQPQPNPAPQQ